MHEMGHIYLRHITSDMPVLSRVRTDKRTFFEVEAQGFARRVICPSIVLHNCHAIEPEHIMKLCGISYEAALHRSAYMKTLETRGMFRTDPLEIEVEQLFEPFVRSYHAQRPDEINQFFLREKVRFCA